MNHLISVRTWQKNTSICTIISELLGCSMKFNYSFKKISRLHNKWYNLVYKVTNIQSRWRIGIRTPELMGIKIMYVVCTFNCETITLQWSRIMLLTSRVHHHVVPLSGLSVYLLLLTLDGDSQATPHVMSWCSYTAAWDSCCCPWL